MLLRLCVQASTGLRGFRTRLRERLVDWAGSERGGVAAEYALLVSLIAIVLVVGAFALGTAINNRLQETADCVNAASGLPC